MDGSDERAMGPSQPYLLRALYQWIVDNGCTPHVVVDTRAPGVQVPAGAARDGQIVLNVAPQAVHALEMGNEEVSFQARFGGVPHAVRFPVSAVQAIYARETGRGMVFPESEATPEPPPEGTPGPGGGEQRPALRVVK